MTRHLAASGAFALALLAASAAHAAADADLAQIRDEIRQLKESYEARIQALENRLRDAEASTAGSSSASPPAPPTAQASAAPPPTGAVAVANPPATAGISAFNPAISAVLQGVYANLSQDPNQYAIHGFVPSGDIAPAKRGFSIAESELALSANVDDKVFGNLIFSLAPDNSVEVEEAYGVLTAVPNGFAPKFGRFLSGIGYLNDQHQHVWDFFDAPLPYQAFLGGQFKSDGLAAQVGRTHRRDVRRVRRRDRRRFELSGYGPQPERHRQRRCIRRMQAATSARATAGARGSPTSNCGRMAANTRRTTLPDNSAQLAFSGKSQLAIADFVWKWAPNGNAMDTNFKLQGEYFWRKENGDLTYDSDGALGLTSTSTYSSKQRGWYVDGVYQFMPYWRVGARYDRLATGSVNYGANGIYLAQDSFNPQRYSVMVDYTPVGVQPVPHPVAAKQGAPRDDRQPALRSIHPDARRAWRAQILKGSA